MVKIFNYKIGDKVFAKVKGYPPWPAKVVGEQNPNTKNRKLNVVFYGTQEIGAIKPEDLSYYLKNKDCIIHKYTKKQGYQDAVKQIEEAVKKDGGDGNDGNASEDSMQEIEMSDSSVTSSASEKKAPKRKVTSLPASEQAAKRVTGRGRRSAAADIKVSEESSADETPTKRGRKKSNITNDDRSEDSDAKSAKEPDAPVESKEECKETDDQKNSPDKQTSADELKSADKEKEKHSKKSNDNGVMEVIQKSPKKDEPVVEKEKDEAASKQKTSDSKKERLPNETETTESESEVEATTTNPPDDKMEETSTASETENLLKEQEGDRTKEEKAVSEKTKQSIEENSDAGGSNHNKAESSDEPESSAIIKVEIVTEHLLKNNIQYAEHVRKNVDLYKNKPAETRQCSQDDTFGVKLPSGKICGIKIHKEWPLTHENEYERALYDEKTAKLALQIKDLLVSGKKTPKRVEELEVIPNIKMSLEDLKEITYAKDVELKTRRLERLKKEAALVTWDSTIKSNLGLDKALPEIALRDLKDFKKFEKDLDGLMLKKHPHIVDTIRRLRKYVGNIKEWSMTDKDLDNFTKMAEKIRNEAELIYNKIKTIIPASEEKGSFWDGFMDLVSEFRTRCKEMSESEVLVLCAEPDSRQSFLDKIDELINPEEANVSASNTSEPVLKETSVKGWTDKK